MSNKFNLAKILFKLRMIPFVPDFEEIEKDERGLIRYLDENKFLDKDLAYEALAKEFHIDFYDLDSEEVKNQLMIDRLIHRVELDQLIEKKCLPIIDHGQTLIVACCNPLDYEIKNWLKFEYAKDIELVLADELKILEILKKKNSHLNVVAERDGEEEGLDKNDAPAIRICNEILAGGVTRDASDIHIEPKQEVVKVRLRIDGTMEEFMEFDAELKNNIASRIKILAGLDISERRRPQDGKLRIGIGKEKYDMRVSTLPTPYGEKIVMRILKSNYDSLKFSTLGLYPALENQMKDILSSTGKLMLVTGPTGSGKTTTLYTCLKFCQETAGNIQTVEDPIEQTIQGINQIQINHNIGVDFVAALRSILRQDPDVIMIGEIRDAETAKIALQAADTGHLVLSTLHTNSAPSAVTRLLNLGIDCSMIAANLAGVLAQRLVRRLCNDCKVPLPKIEYIKYQNALNFSGFDVENSIMYTCKGCHKCNGSGYKGRVGIYSFLRITSEIAGLIFNSASLTQVISTAKEAGFRDLHEAAADLLTDGTTSLEEALPYIIEQSAEAERARPKTISISVEEVNKIRIEAQNIIRQKELDQSADNRTEAIASSESTMRRLETRIPSQSIAKPKILVIDDSDDARYLLSVMLKSNLFEVKEAINGKEGLAEAKSFQPDVILCDYEMPIMNGKDFLISAKKDLDLQRIPVVMLTAIDTEDNEAMLFELGASDFISKDTSYKLMLTRIKRFLH